MRNAALFTAPRLYSSLRTQNQLSGQGIEEFRKCVSDAPLLHARVLR
jgi:hypothetical protein